MNEHSCARSLTKALRDKGCYVWKINANFAGGVPDFWICGNAGDIWCELKWTPHLPKRDTTLVVPSLSSQQIRWLYDRSLQGVRIVVILATADGWVVFSRPSEWRDGITAGEARARLKPHKEVAQHICSLVGASEVLRNEPASAFPDVSGTTSDCRAPTGAMGLQKGPSRVDPSQGRRGTRPHAGRARTVPEPAHRPEHGLRAGDVPPAGGGPL